MPWQARTFAADAAIAAMLFVGAAVIGHVSYTRYVTSGHRPFFYQSYFEPAVMTACGRGFVVSPPQLQLPALRAFLLQQTDRFSCDQLPPDLKVGPEWVYQRPWLYLFTSVGLAWKVLGISWSGLGPFFGLLLAVTTVLAYAIGRLIVGRIAAVLCAVVMCVSPLQLANLPNLRDYAKAPFTLALLWILVALVLERRRRRDVILLALGYGLVMGIGYGFRTDLIIDIPLFLITVVLFLPGGVLRDLPLKAAAIACFALGFVAAGWPIITTVVASGGCQWHVALLGLTTSFDDALGVTGGSYGWGHLYNDNYVWAIVASYAARVRPDPGYIEYCSPAYDSVSWEYLWRLVRSFPADFVTRGYAAALHVLNLPFDRLRAFPYIGVLLAAVMVVAASWSSVRLALFAVFLVLYLGGYPAIQFLPRHYFPFELIGLIVLAWLVDRGVRRATAILRDTTAWPAVERARIRRSAVFAVVVAFALVAPLYALRAYQNGRVMRLLDDYAGARTAALPLEPVAPGQLRLATPEHAHPPSSVDVVAALGRVQARFVEVAIDSAACRPGTTVTFRYDPGYPATDFSSTVPLPPAAAGGAPTRLFEPVYHTFTGIDISDPSPACLPRVSTVDDAGRFPLLLPARLDPNWRSQPQYQHLAQLR